MTVQNSKLSDFYSKDESSSSFWDVCTNASTYTLSWQWPQF